MLPQSKVMLKVRSQLNYVHCVLEIIKYIWNFVIFSHMNIFLNRYICLEFGLKALMRLKPIEFEYNMKVYHFLQHIKIKIEEKKYIQCRLSFIE